MAVGYLTNCQSLFSLFAIITSGKGKSRKNLSNRSRKLNLFFFQNVMQFEVNYSRNFVCMTVGHLTKSCQKFVQFCLLTLAKSK